MKGCLGLGFTGPLVPSLPACLVRIRVLMCSAQRLPFVQSSLGKGSDWSGSKMMSKKMSLTPLPAEKFPEFNGYAVFMHLGWTSEVVLVDGPNCRQEVCHWRDTVSGSQERAFGEAAGFSSDRSTFEASDSVSCRSSETLGLVPRIPNSEVRIA